jgi:hypothetical protein
VSSSPDVIFIREQHGVSRLQKNMQTTEEIGLPMGWILGESMCLLPHSEWVKDVSLVGQMGNWHMPNLTPETVMRWLKLLGGQVSLETGTQRGDECGALGAGFLALKFIAGTAH